MVPVPEERASAEQDAVRHDEADLLWRAITALPDAAAAGLVLRYYLDQSEAEIADTLEVSRGSVKTAREPRPGRARPCLEARM